MFVFENYPVYAHNTVAAQMMMSAVTVNNSF